MESFWDILYVPLGWILRVCNAISPTYLLTLLLFSILIKLIMLPLSYKQHKNSLKQASFRPKEMAIYKKYQGRVDRTSQQKKQEELQRLYQAEGFNQFAGCLPLLIQLPIIFCVYQVVTSPLRYICGFSSELVKKIMEQANASRQIDALNALRANFDSFKSIEGFPADLTVSELPNFSLLGIDLSATPQFGVNWLILIPILNFAAAFFASKITRKFNYQSPQMTLQGQGSANESMSMKIMNLLMPLMSAYISLKTPAVIGIYWIYQNLLGVVQQFAFYKLKPYPTFTEEEYKEAERLIAGKKKKQKYREKKNLDPDRPRVRSLHHIDDDDYNAHVVESEEEKAARQMSDKVGGDGMLTPFPMKDYSDKKKK